MSNYINSANQTLLWNTVNKIPEFHQLSPPKKDFEFKQIIEFFYRKNIHKPILTLQELQQLNRETILAFVPKTQQQPQQQPQQQQPQQQYQQPQQQYQQPQQHYQQPQQPQQQPLFETKQEKSQREFEERQNIYKQMNTKPDLPSPEIFKDKYEDSAIENMDVLINQYQKQRELEFNQYIPPPPLNQNPLNQNPQNIKKNPRIRILEDISEKEKEKIGINEEDDNEKTKKVSFSSKTQEYSTDDYWDKKIAQLEERIFLLEEKLKLNYICTLCVQQEVSLSLENMIQKIK